LRSKEAETEPADQGQQAEEFYALEVLEDAITGTVDRARQRQQVRTAIQVQHEEEEREISKEITSRAQAGERFRSSLPKD